MLQVLHKNVEFMQKYQCVVLKTYGVDMDIGTYRRHFSEADLLIYQNYKAMYRDPQWSTDRLLPFLKTTALKISVVNMTNTAFWPFFKKAATFQTKSKDRTYQDIEPILKLFHHQKLSPSQVVRLFETNQIHFDFARKWKLTMDQAHELETRCDVVMTDFVQKHYKKHRLFLTHNHPSQMLLVYVTNQILNRLGIASTLNPMDCTSERESILSQYEIYPICKPVQKYFQFEWIKDQDLNNAFYTREIPLIYNQYQNNQDKKFIH